jgi:hypothetical protein
MRTPVAIDEAKLAREATSLCAGAALSALRSPRARGAVHLEDLVDRLSDGAESGPSRTALQNFLKRRSQAETAFDVVCRHVFEPNTPESRQGWGNAYQAFVHPPLRPVDDDRSTTWVETAVKAMLASAYEEQGESSRQDITLVGILVLSAALMHRHQDAARSTNPETAETTAEETDATAARVLRDRQSSWDAHAEVYLAALRWILRTTGRRAKAGYSERDIVVAMHSLFDGYLVRSLVDSDRYPMATLVDMTWDLSMSLTEPGILHRNSGDDERDRLVACALELTRDTSEIPSWDAVATMAGLDGRDERQWFSTDSSLVVACIDAALAHAWELRQVAEAVPQATEAALEALLAAVETVNERYRVLTQATADAPIWREIASLIEQLLDQVNPDTRALPSRAAAANLLTEVLKGKAYGSNWRQLLTFAIAERSPHVLGATGSEATA